MENNNETNIKEITHAEKASNISLILMCLSIISIFIHYFSIPFNFTPDLIPESIFYNIFEESAILGLGLSIGLLFSSIARAFRKFRGALIVDAICLVGIPILWKLYNYF